MTTVPLYSSPIGLNASHGVFAPGGYERWYFEAEDVYRDVRIVAALYSGYPFHPEYLRRYERYLRHPTRIPPPVPADYPVACFAVYRSKDLLAHFIMQYPSGAMRATDGAAGVQIGPNQFVGGAASQLTLSGITSKKGGIWAELHAGRMLGGIFNLTSSGSDNSFEERTYISPEISGATHRWIVTNPLCQVTGTIRCAGETIEFAGRGYHDQSYGTAAIGDGVKYWMSGQVLFEESAYAFQFIRPADPECSDEVHLVEATQHTKEISIGYADAKAFAMTTSGVRYPTKVNFEDVLELDEPRLLDTSLYSAQLLYSARIRGRSGRAYCQIVHPNRLRWPILGGMIAKGIDQGAMK